MTAGDKERQAVNLTLEEMERTMKKLMIAVLAMGAFGAMDVSAQGTSANGNASVSVPEVLSLTVTNTAIAFGSATATDIDNGFINTSTTSTIDTRANVLHDVTIQADAEFFTYSGTQTDPNKPASDLRWTNDGGASWTPLDDGSAADVATSLARGENAGAATIGYQLALSLAGDVPGDYSLGFTYTVVAN